MVSLFASSIAVVASGFLSKRTLERGQFSGIKIQITESIVRANKIWWRQILDDADPVRSTYLCFYAASNCSAGKESHHGAMSPSIV